RALKGPQDCVDDMVDTFEERRDIIVDGLADMGLEVPVPQGAFYVFPPVPDGWVDKAIDEGVIVVPGDAFGDRGAGKARISYANDTEELKQAIEILRNVTARTK
ncbi:MAG: aminotransferase class I/II-fold pyridoxal phosphate-dependent enzyme, partial [Halobacteriaceae archaeon]